MITLADMQQAKNDIRGHIWNSGYRLTEGSSSEAEMYYIADVIQRYKVLNAVEIGFNAGYSSCAMLLANPDIRVVSFDLGRHPYVTPAKEWIDKFFPGRHKLIRGNSLKTVPIYVGGPFSFAFIDGGHSYSVAKADIINMRRHCIKGSLVMMDDLTPWHSFGRGPTQAWTEATAEGIIQQIELYKDGWPVNTIEPPGVRIWALGRYH